jgi:putative glycosyltransferase (TIGR04348 family)
VRIGLVTPAPLESRRGNAVTARRWAAILRELGHQPRLIEVPSDPSCEAPLPPLDHEILVALHARRSAPAAAAFRRARPHAPLVVALTGTDLYADLASSPEARATVALADRLIVLQERGLRSLPAEQRSKGRVIHQGVAASSVTPRPRPTDRFRAVVLAHLRPVKAPLLAARASREVPPEARLEVIVLGEALDEALGEAARAEARENPRFHWLGDLPRDEALSVLSGAHLLVSTSQLEGGANAVGEALALGVPVISTRIDGALGLLGEDYPGLVPVGDAAALAAMLWRAEREPAFYDGLRARCHARRDLVDPARERQAWADLLAELAS